MVYWYSLRLQAGVTIIINSQPLLVPIKIFDDSVRIVALTCDGHLVLQLHDDAAREELSGEVEEVGVVEHDQELGQLALLAGVHAGPVVYVHVNVHLDPGRCRQTLGDNSGRLRARRTS